MSVLFVELVSLPESQNNISLFAPVRYFWVYLSSFGDICLWAFCPQYNTIEVNVVLTILNSDPP